RGRGCLDDPAVAGDLEAKQALGSSGPRATRWFLRRRVGSPEGAPLAGATRGSRAHGTAAVGGRRGKKSSSKLVNHARWPEGLFSANDRGWAACIPTSWRRIGRSAS